MAEPADQRLGHAVDVSNGFTVTPVWLDHAISMAVKQ